MQRGRAPARRPCCIAEKAMATSWPYAFNRLGYGRNVIQRQRTRVRNHFCSVATDQVLSDPCGNVGQTFLRGR